jgi:hypothetical protein
MLVLFRIAPIPFDCGYPVVIPFSYYSANLLSRVVSRRPSIYYLLVCISIYHTLGNYTQKVSIRKILISKSDREKQRISNNSGLLILFLVHNSS